MQNTARLLEQTRDTSKHCEAQKQLQGKKFTEHSSNIRKMYEKNCQLHLH